MTYISDTLWTTNGTSLYLNNLNSVWEVLEIS